MRRSFRQIISKNDILRLFKEHGLFIAAAAFYSLIISERLRHFPPYFFCDEAIHLVEAESLLRTGRDSHAVRYPLFPLGLGQYQLSLSVYLQIPFNYLFGFQEEAVRARSAFLSVLGVFGAYLLVRSSGARRFAWVTPFVYLLTPVWFLHSRTGFESFQACVFFIWALWFYVLGLSGNQRFLVAWAIMSAAAFYSYLPARGWVGVSTLALLLVNLRMHLQRWRGLLVALLTLAALLLPFAYAAYVNPNVALSRLRAVGLESIYDDSSQEFLTHFTSNYLAALDPRFWFNPNSALISGPEQRHALPTMALLPLWLAPFIVLGLACLLLKYRNALFATLLTTLLCIPVVAAPFGITNLRVLPIAALVDLFACIGLSWLCSIIFKTATFRKAASLILCLILALQALTLRNWVQGWASREYPDYAFYGIQYGAREVFDWIELHREDFKRFSVDSSLFNAGEIFLRTYLSEATRSKVQFVDSLRICDQLSELEERTVWIMHSNIVGKIAAMPCIIEMNPIHSIKDPRNVPLFSFNVPRLTSNIQELLEEEQRKRSELVISMIESSYLGRVSVRHTRLDIGTAQDIFDRSDITVARSAGINPFVIHVPIGTSKPAAATLVISNNHVATAQFSAFKGCEEMLKLAEVTIRTDGGLSKDHVIPLEIPVGTEEIKVEIKANDAGAEGFVHIRTIEFSD